jgi:hypothetical protein
MLASILCENDVKVNFIGPSLSSDP